MDARHPGPQSAYNHGPARYEMTAYKAPAEYDYYDEYEEEWEEENQPRHEHGQPQMTGYTSPAPSSPFSDQTVFSPLDSPATSTSAWSDRPVDSPSYQNKTPYFSAQVTPYSPPPSAEPHAPMTVFPDTWDPPADHEYRDLPAGLRFKSKLGNMRKGMFSRKKEGASEGGNPEGLKKASTFAGSEPEKEPMRTFSAFGRKDRNGPRRWD